MTVKNTPLGLSIVGAIITISGTALMITSDSFSIENLIQPLGVFFLGVVISSIAVVLRKKQKKTQEGRMENDKQD